MVHCLTYPGIMEKSQVAWSNKVGKTIVTVMFLAFDKAPGELQYW